MPINIEDLRRAVSRREVKTELWVGKGRVKLPRSTVDAVLEGRLLGDLDRPGFDRITTGLYLGRESLNLWLAQNGLECLDRTTPEVTSP